MNAAVQVTVIGKDCGTDPLSVVNFAVDEMKRQKIQMKNGRGVKYDHVWCVVDRDQHRTLKRALNKAQAHQIGIALSTPCFEVWFLLHFEYTTRNFMDCAAVERDLKVHLPNYSKTMVPAEVLDEDSILSAISNAGRLRKHNEDTLSENPSTDVDRVVKIVAFQEEAAG